MVTVLTDAPLPDYVDGIRLQAFHERDGQSLLIFDREPEVRVGAGELLIPTTLAIVGNERPDDRVRLRLLARKFGTPRVLREAVTQVPSDRIIELHLPIEWLCDGSATTGDPMFCSDPNYTCAGGRCIPKWIDPSTLPSYQPPSGLGGNESASCFDVQRCFANSTAVPLSVAGCSLVGPGQGLQALNLALVVKPDSGGHCIPGGNCLVPISRGPLGWDIASDGARIVLPAAVCTTKANLILAVVASQQCPTKRPAQALCGAWSPFAQSAPVDAGAALDAAANMVADGSAGMPVDASAANSCRENADCVSGNCVTGVCCDDACTGPCRSCAVPGSVGICRPLLAGTVDVTCTASLPNTCGLDGTCDGEGSCRLWAQGTVCGASSCMMPAAVSTFACNATGSCQTMMRNCAPYRCGSEGCLLACTTADDCAPGFYCGGERTCVAQKAQGQACTSPAQCAQGFCADGVCCNSTCDGTCSQCALPGSQGVCTPIEFGSSPAAECSEGGMCNGLNQCVASPVAKIDFNKDSGSTIIATPPLGLGTGTLRAGATPGSPAVTGTFIPGLNGNALRLDGALQHVVFPASPALDRLTQAGGRFTISAWVRPASLPAGNAWAVTRTNNIGMEFVYALGLRDGIPTASLAYWYCTGTAAIPSASWTHLAATYDGLHLTLYANGAQVCTRYWGLPINSSTTPLVLGAQDNAGYVGSLFPGDIDEVSIFDRAMSAAEINKLMEAR